MRPITRRVSTVRLPKPCGYCMGDVYIGVEGYDGAVCVDCKKQPTKKQLPDGYPNSVHAPYGQPSTVKKLPDGDDFFLDRMAGYCGNGCGQRLNYGTRVIKRGPFLYLPACDPKPDAKRCPCGTLIDGTDMLCDRCYEAHQGLLYAWWRPVAAAPVRGFGKTTDGTPLQAPHLAMRDHLKQKTRR